MRDVIIVFAVLLGLLLLISVFGGSIRYAPTYNAVPDTHPSGLQKWTAAAGQLWSSSTPSAQPSMVPAAIYGQGMMPVHGAVEPFEDATDSDVAAALPSPQEEENSSAATIEPFQSGSCNMASW